MDPLKEIAFDQHVIVTLPSEKGKIVELKANGSVSLGKFGAFYVNDVVGYPLGTKFEIYYEDQVAGTEEYAPLTKRDTKKVPIGKVRVLERDTSLASSAPNVSTREGTADNVELANVKSSENNRDLINLGSEIQKMSASEIEELKKQSMSSNEIISRIIESHGSFDKKTVHSQEKYLKRKKQKFNKEFTIDYLSSSALLDFLIEKGDIQRVLDLSEETMGMLLNLANVRANGTYLCMDETGGLVVYAMMERMFGGTDCADAVGTIVVLHENEHANLDLLKFSNYSEQFIGERIVTVSLLDFFEPARVEEIESRFQPLPKEEVFALKAGKKNTYYRKLKWYKTQMRLLKYTTDVAHDGLVVASTLYLPELIPLLSDRVHGSRPVVCYSQFKETLLELSHVLYADLRFLAPTIYETRCRPYQTIRGKLHPLMTMRGGGGYLLCAHRVIPTDPEK
ncbi:tRNA 1-methyladenosine methyltransferase subunit GCD10 KNAG_0I01880 [Huiozyma naganishii CBS 8797]|uniref:tRNA (adenine(58)-N(1))-methyltransferase non-catalytic subunit TRM6 n=1 Tax=Huiozyma naganishii (strain ATCC MYA-139 / BCRC 22969 / CBS 8797 / KCTC 17520 / NBRC 10181 / NCYC 3082 / Yp74L-3) TaxID=1071383 RepID=J7RQD2_HUIN7|nr:hypothetical protein KNAG_0I01880 [Kazachstania naganishii CBS 8797]CCK71973.1 hypothetical protein KNAG_0I01880 [Kazachstania naganishii CBS 8797]